MESMFYDKLDNNQVRCNTCHHYCVIKENKVGICGVRLNIDRTLYAINYEKTIARHIDPIEKKPLYYFLPGTMTYSLSTVGCNMSCPWCQNHEISQVKYVGMRLPGEQITPQEHLDEVLKRNIPSISYTYTEPTIFVEYALELMKLAHEHSIKNIWVTNGYMSPEVLEAVLPYLDAVNIDYKGSQEKIYESFCTGQSNKVLQNIKTMVEHGVHVEITTLIVPTVNDSLPQIRAIANDIATISKSIPWHISRYFPNYKFTHIPKTSILTLQQAFQIGLEEGLETIHLGNV